MSKEAMKLALEALESATPKYTRQRADQKTLGGALDYWKLEQHQRLKAITSLRQAIDAASQHTEAEKQEGQSNFCAQCEALSRELKAIKQEQSTECVGEPVAYIHRNEYNEYRLEPHDNFDIKSIPFNVDVPLFKEKNT